MLSARSVAALALVLGGAAGHQLPARAGGVAMPDRFVNVAPAGPGALTPSDPVAVPRLVRIAHVAIPAADKSDLGRRVTAVAVSGDGHTAVVSAQEVVVLSDALPGGRWRVTARMDRPRDDREADRAIGLSADARTLAIGNRKSVWIYTRKGATWSRSAQISSPPREDKFVTGVALSGDGRTLLIGAARGQAREGRRWEGVFVYMRTTRGWSRQAFLDSPVRNGFAGFGQAIASSATGDAAVIGAPKLDANIGIPELSANRAERAPGAAYIYKRSAGRWRLSSELRPSETVDGSRAIGRAVSISADGATVAVGGLGVYVLRGQGSASAGFARTATFDAPAGHPARPSFGTKVALSTDGQTLVTAAPLRSLHGAEAAGRAYRFVHSHTGWRFGGVLDPAQATPRHSYGSAIAADATGRRVVVAENPDSSQPMVIDIYQRPPTVNTRPA